MPKQKSVQVTPATERQVEALQAFGTFTDIVRIAIDRMYMQEVGMKTMEEMTLGELGRFVAGRTADTRAAAIARSSAPQLRYDAVITDILRNPEHRHAFSEEERKALASRIGDEKKREAVNR